MQKLASEFTNTIIITRREQAVLGELEDIILNPKTKVAIGISFKLVGGKKETLVANTSDIVGLGTNFIMLESADNASPPEEIIRLKETLDLDIHLIGSRVVDENGRHLGKVNNFSVNLKNMRLERLYITSSSLVKILAKDLIIQANSILKIEKDLVTVEDGTVKTGKKITSLVGEGKPAQIKTIHNMREER